MKLSITLIQEDPKFRQDNKEVANSELVSPKSDAKSKSVGRESVMNSINFTNFIQRLKEGGMEHFTARNSSIQQHHEGFKVKRASSIFNEDFSNLTPRRNIAIGPLTTRSNSQKMLFTPKNRDVKRDMKLVNIHHVTNLASPPIGLYEPKSQSPRVPCFVTLDKKETKRRLPKPIARNSIDCLDTHYGVPFRKNLNILDFGKQVPRNEILLRPNARYLKQESKVETKMDKHIGRPIRFDKNKYVNVSTYPEPTIDQMDKIEDKRYIIKKMVASIKEHLKQYKIEKEEANI